MRNPSRLPLALAALCLLSASAAPADVISYAVDVGGRYHQASTVLKDIPYDEGDWSYHAGFEAHEGAGYWEVGADFGDATAGTNGTAMLITPQVNLMAEDRGVVGGIGLLSTYNQDAVEGEDEWSDLYFQFSIGIDMPIGKRIGIRLLAHYPFSDWGDLSDFDFSDMEYSGTVRYRF